MIGPAGVADALAEKERVEARGDGAAKSAFDKAEGRGMAARDR